MDSHPALFLLRASLSTPRLLYIFRCSRAYKSQEILHEIDEVIRKCLRIILNVNLHDETWDQASLPVRAGGLGVRKASELALPSYTGSLSDLQELIKQILPTAANDAAQTPLDECTAAFEDNWGTLPETPSQHLLDKVVINVTQDRLRHSRRTQVQKARLEAAFDPLSGKWLQALPSPHLGTMLDNNQLRIVAGLRLGESVCVPHNCALCGAKVSPTGEHALSCRKSAGRFPRHSALNDVIFRAMQSAHIPAQKEPMGLCQDTSLRPDGLTLTPWSEGRSLVWDATVSCTLATSYVGRTSVDPGAAANLAEERKTRKYSELQTKFIVQPIAIETLGTVGQETKTFLRELGRRVSDATNDRRASEFLMQKISIEVQRGNAIAMQGSLPTCGGLPAIL